MIKRLLALAFIAAAVALPAQAEVTPSNPSVWLTAGGVSRHFRDNDRFNERNNGVGLEVHTSNELAFIAGTFKNSVYKRTDYAAVAWQPISFWNVKMGVVGGVMTGYPRMNNGGAFPAILPMMSMEYKRVGINFLVIPDFKGTTGSVAVQFKFKLK